MAACDTDEIIKGLKELEQLKDLRVKITQNTFAAQFPELNGIGAKLDQIIENTEEALNQKMAECGSIQADEIPEGYSLEE